MTKVQGEALNRVKAKHAMVSDLEAFSGTFNVGDIKSILELIESQRIVLDSTIEDLTDIKGLLSRSSPDLGFVLELIDSAMILLTYEE